MGFNAFGATPARVKCTHSIALIKRTFSSCSLGSTAATSSSQVANPANFRRSAFTLDVQPKNRAAEGAPCAESGHQVERYRQKRQYSAVRRKERHARVRGHGLRPSSTKFPEMGCTRARAPPRPRSRCSCDAARTSNGPGKTLSATPRRARRGGDKNVASGGFESSLRRSYAIGPHSGAAAHRRRRR